MAEDSSLEGTAFEISEARPRAGTVALLGRPNAGKSTLMNHLLAEKVAIVSDKPQTTRQRLVGILSEPRGQMVFHDTPGLHKPLHRMNRAMVQHSVDAMNGADVVVVLVDASLRFGSGDRYLLDLVSKVKAPKILVLNKVDKVSKPKLLPLLELYGREQLFEEMVPLSALSGDGCQVLLELLWPRLPVAPASYDPELLTVHPERFLATERIREKVLAQTRDELPFSTAVVLDRWEEDEYTGMLSLYARILVERPGQKKILIGSQGSQIKAIGTAARLDLEEFLERKVFLDLHVQVAAGWREDRAILADLDRNLYARFEAPVDDTG